jgi:hypothetical protein
VRVLGAAIEADHCAYAALKADPFVANLRTSPEFSQLLSAASQCQKRFLPQQGEPNSPESATRAQSPK